MKKSFSSAIAAFLLTFTVATPQLGNAATFLPYLDALRAELTSQIEAINADGVDSSERSLLSALNKSSSALNKPGAANLANDLKLLSNLANTLNKSALSNHFAPLLDAAANNYGAALLEAAVTSSNRLNGAFPSGPKTAAGRNMSQMFGYLSNADITAETLAAVKLLGLAAKKLVVTDKLVTKALAVRPPPAEIRATVTGSLNTTIKTLGAGIVPGQGLILSGAQQQGVGVKQINFVLNNVAEGTSTVNLTGGNINILQLVNRVPVNINYGNGVGTATVTRNNANNSAFGTFTFTASGISGTTGSITVTGEFFGTF